MPIDVNDVIELLCRVSDLQGMKAAVKHSCRGALVAGVGAFLGGMLGGPLGIAVGSAVGGLVGAQMSSGQFKPVPQILLELPPKAKQRLYNDANAILRKLDWTSLAQITVQVMSSASLQAELQGVVANFLTNEFHAEIKYAA